MRKFTCLAVALCLCLAACTGSRESAPGPIPSAQPSVLPLFPAQPDSAGEFQPTACRFVLPDDLQEGVDITCGFLSVPEQRGAPQGAGGRLIQLHVAVFHRPGGAEHADAVIFLSGGPGASALESIRYGAEALTEPVFASGRDLVMFDQRGIGLSRPALDCPEFEQLAVDLLDYQVNGRYVVSDEIFDLFEQSLITCNEELRQIADLSAYNSAASAEDVNDLRLALGYEQVNLWGGSYGTRLALEVMRRHPEGLRSVVLDAVYPPDVDLYAAAPANFSRALEKMFASCTANTICQQNFPNLRQAYFDTVHRLNASPVMRQIENYQTGEKLDALLDGDVLLGLTFRLLYDSSWRYALPKQIYAASQGDYADFDLVRGALLSQSDISSRGMMFSVQCHEEAPFGSLERFQAEAARYPELASMYTDSLIGELVYRVCPTWGAGHADLSANQPVTSDLYTLVMNGEFDPITPPAWGWHAAETLENAYTYEYPGVGHGASVLPGCPRQMLLAFWADPARAPDDACLAGMNK